MAKYFEFKDQDAAIYAPDMRKHSSKMAEIDL